MTLPVPPLHHSDTRTLVLNIAQTVYEMIKGRDNSVSSVTLTANTTTTTVTDNLFNSDMMPILMPTTANAAGAIANTYVSSRTNGSFVLTHANTATTDRTFIYSRRG